jgi:hypothetical protein
MPCDFNVAAGRGSPLHLKNLLEDGAHPTYGLNMFKILAGGCDDGAPGNEAGIFCFHQS